MPDEIEVHLNYNPDTCTTVGELRRMGAELPTEIPDEAWVSKGSLRFIPGEWVQESSDKWTNRMTVVFEHPIRWCTTVFDGDVATVTSYEARFGDVP